MVIGKPTNLQRQSTIGYYIVWWLSGTQYTINSIVYTIIDCYRTEYYIQKITSKTPAALDGRLKPGDRILEVGEQSLDNATCDQATKLLMDSPALLQLTVYRRPSDRDSKSRSEFKEWSLNLM